ncbi:MAG: transglutaminase-like domain-containing protein [Candidatus Methylomirabilia bacterium]
MGNLTAFWRRRWLQAGAAVAVLAVGFILGDQVGEAEPVDPSFHDIRVIHPKDFSALVAPEATELIALAGRLGSLEAAYGFVRDRIVFEPSAPAGAPAQTLREGRASCLGKATLLTSLIRALGVPAGSVRVVTGQVALGNSLVDHAWVDLEYGSLCLQLDPTDLLGTHDFLAFPGQEYVRSFVSRELFCFNDEGFAAVSQLNRLRGQHP